MANPSADFPTSVHTATDVSAFSGTSTLGGSTPTQTDLSGKVEQEIVATQTKLGTGSSTPQNKYVLVGTGTGTSEWTTTLADLTITGAKMDGIKNSSGEKTLEITDNATAVNYLTLRAGSTAQAVVIAAESVTDTDVYLNLTSQNSGEVRANGNRVLTTDDGSFSDKVDKSTLTAKGDIFVATGSGTVVRLAVGANDTVLTAASGEAAGVKWASVSAGGDVATDAIWNAKGDLAIGTGSDTASRLGVGTNGYVLTADSGEATGIKWAAAGSGDMLLGTAQTITAAKTFNSGTLLDKGTQVFNVKAYGAVGDDSTDDTAAIQSAIAAAGAAGGGIVFFPVGTYKCQTNPLQWYSGTTVYSGVVLVGASATASIIKQYTTGVDILKGLNDASDSMQLLNAGVEDLTLLFGGTASNSGNGLYCKAGEADSPSFQQFHMKNVIIRDCAGSGKYGVNFESIIVAYLDNVLVQDGSGGFYINGGANSTGFSSVNTSTTLRNCYSNGNSGIGYNIENSTYVHLDNTACDVESGTADGYYINECASVVLTAPGFENAGTFSGLQFHIADTTQFVINGGFGYGNTNILMSITGSKGVINAFRNESDDSSATTGLSVGSGSEVWDMGSDWSGADTPVTVNSTGRYYTPGIPRVGTTTSASSITANSGAHDQYDVTALAATLTINAPSGTARDGETILYRLKDNGTARSLTWNAVFRAIGVTNPTTTVISKTLYVLTRYNSADSKWDVLATGQEA